MKFEALSAFDVLEHIEDPMEFIKNLMEQNSYKNIIFSTELYQGSVPDKSCWYYVFNHRQYISSCTSQTPQNIADKLELHFKTNNGTHCFPATR